MRYLWLSIGILLLCAAAIVGGVALFRARVGSVYWVASSAMAPTLRADDRVVVYKMAYRAIPPSFGDIVVFRAPSAAAPFEKSEKTFLKRVVGVPGDTIRITRGYVRINGVEYTHADMRSLLAPSRSDKDTLYVKLVQGQLLLGGHPVPAKDIAKAAGKPGARVEVVSGRVYRNGKVLDEPYVAEDCDGEYPMPNTPDKWVAMERGVRVVRIPEGRLLVMGDNRNDSNDSRFWGLLESNRVLGRVTAIFSPQERAGPVKRLR